MRQRDTANYDGKFDLEMNAIKLRTENLSKAKQA